MMTRKSKLFGCLLWVLVCVPVAANRYSNNPDRIIDRSVDRRFSPIGELESIRPVKDKNGSDSHDYGTGFLVSPCLVMTNYHVVFGNDAPPESNIDYAMVFRAGVGTTAPFAGNTKATPILWGAYTPSGRNDWALLKLNSCVGSRYNLGWYTVQLMATTELTGMRVAVVGFPGDVSRGELHYGEGTIDRINETSGLLKFTASMAPGQSGSPVFTTEHGQLKLVGLNTRQELYRSETYCANKYRIKCANEMQNVTIILTNPSVSALVDADVARIGVSNPLQTK